MSKSKQPNLRATQALPRRSQSLPLKPLDFEHRFIDDLIGPHVGNMRTVQTASALRVRADDRLLASKQKNKVGLNLPVKKKWTTATFIRRGVGNRTREWNAADRQLVNRRPGL